LSEPPSPQAWHIDGRLRGHTVQDVIRMSVWRQEWADEQVTTPVWVISPDIEDQSPFRRWRK
jgi:hypothetical protein